MSPGRTYVVLGVAAIREGEPRTLREVGRVVAADAEEAIRGALENTGGWEASSDPSSAYVAVAERNWVELPVRREVQTRLLVGTREFVLPDGQRRASG